MMQAELALKLVNPQCRIQTTLSQHLPSKTQCLSLAQK